ncbi:unnamed protein product [Didymodactylos carnosus]|uniref:Uncharacterized protein n=1 Tax=Didymodactylos carnosus TaxID=1234261 RepID=A0A814FR58_9BILA|nr:unnamed protein product [Didymodactylos carnosus]CAF1024874.1 unnamed protein product [Didymodactylos carnosus]CAF3758663.1 unnamed protein product [Didymodactylos carnosus]CAF3793347.1 unnamed protein product [Didymodactylos carnosus]
MRPTFVNICLCVIFLLLGLTLSANAYSLHNSNDDDFAWNQFDTIDHGLNARGVSRFWKRVPHRAFWKRGLNSFYGNTMDRHDPMFDNDKR